jgi:hypothetical protein
MNTKLVPTEEVLRQYLPNVQLTVQGEQPLLEKLAPYLLQAEQWLVENFTAQESYEVLCTYVAEQSTRVAATQLLIAEAFRQAVPSLDMVLTANGFAVVSNTNLTPASKPRVDRLLGTLLTLRDNCLRRLLRQLPKIPQWLTSEQAAFFGGTLFPSLEVVEQVGVQEHLWERYQELRPRIMQEEETLAQTYFSEELLTVLRQGALRESLSSEEQLVTRGIRTQVLARLRGENMEPQRMVYLVEYIRQRPEVFPTWHSSVVAQLFSPPIFENQKGASGYFF